MYRNIKISLIFVSMFLLGSLYSSSSVAGAEKDMKILAKSFSFIVNGPVGDVVMDIFYDPQNPDSVFHANEMLDSLSGGSQWGEIALSGRLIRSVDDINSRVIFLTRGTEFKYEDVILKAQEHNAITVSNDEDCISKGCVLVINTDVVVDIFLSVDLAERLKNDFSAAFSMMVTKR